jgi:hypothetical protein
MSSNFGNTGKYGSSVFLTHRFNTFRNSYKKPVEIINYNNTVSFINVIKRKRPKRKLIKRRCPNINMRKSKGTDFKQPRFLEVFQVVEFENIACVSSSGLEGTCLHEYECESNGGTTMGTCADGYGTCCVSK